MKIKKGDNVIVISGKEKGKKGKIVRAIPQQNKIIIEGLNVLKKAQRPRKSGEKGQMVNVSMPIHISNVMVIDPKTDKGSRIGKKRVGDKMVRVTKKSEQEI